ncbi:pyruvate formate lyase family protein [Candidatus Epulonipiscium viviparus]|uniref:pyruvate formate lyase family protein n=1 Tax=Candidatus Epulonipiscium viviparus TaxID=420336 RepID=UPI0027380E61|nr:pyruvate formate lyase family protein [Candidatus Epulopiscium viviparus]
MDSILEKKIEALFGRSVKETFMERIQYTFETEFMFANDSFAVKYGKTLYHILDNISVVLEDDMKIVGCVKVRIPKDSEVEEILKVYHRWWDMSVEDRFKKVAFYYTNGWLKCRPYWFASFGHLGIDYEDLVFNGYDSIIKRAQTRLTKSCNEKQQEFLNGIIISIQALSNFYERYATAAVAAGKIDLADDLKTIAHQPAKTFKQALQHIWLNTLVLQKVSGCGVLNFSRLDKYLQPLYDQDIKAGILTREEALNLVEEFYFRNNEMMAQTDHMSEETAGTKDTLELAFDDPNYLTLGGINADGTSAVCELSYIMLEAANEMRLRNPFIVVRYHEGIAEDFWKLCAKAMRNNATVVVYNDETMIPALKYHNISAPEVYDYGFWGCNDPNIAAYEGGLRQLWMNMAKPLELALHQGDYPLEPKKEEDVAKECAWSIEDRMMGIMIGPYYGIKTKPANEINSMEEFLKIFEIQFDHLISEFRKGFEADFIIEQHETIGKMRIEDCFLKGTIENAVTWTEGGTKYHKIVAQGCGLATVINALYIIEKVVFDEKLLTLEELATMMRNNYEGNEHWRLKFKNKYPKFGNDIDEVDKYAQIITDIFMRIIAKHNGPEYLYQFWPTYSTDRAFTIMGEHVGATPDGRLAREPISENQSPADGSDLEGVTAMLNSLSKVPFNRITGGPLNLRLHPTVAAGDKGIDTVAALLKTYMQKGGMQLQLNVIDAETLKLAQENPDKYRSLCVRVTGYSAFFVEMGKKAQDELIHRTQHQI